MPRLRSRLDALSRDLDARRAETDGLESFLGDMDALRASVLARMEAAASGTLPPADPELDGPRAELSRRLSRLASTR